MSPERVLADPLSGAEIIIAVTDRIATRLRRDCFLTANMAYQSFRCKVKIELVAIDCGEERVVNVEETVQHNPEDEALDQADAQLAEIEMTDQPPNETRVETGQPVPVLGKGLDGKPEIRHVKYARKNAKVTA